MLDLNEIDCLMKEHEERLKRLERFFPKEQVSAEKKRNKRKKGDVKLLESMRYVKATTHAKPKIPTHTHETKATQLLAGGMDHSGDSNSKRPVHPRKDRNKLISILLFILLFPVAGSAQFYCALATGFVPVQHKGYFNVQLTLGTTVSKVAFIEYNQTLAATTWATVPSYFQIRAGANIKIHRTTVMRPFVGSGVRQAYYNEAGKVKPCITYGLYLFQQVDDSFHMKYELAMNGKKLMPSVGIGVSF